MSLHRIPLVLAICLAPIACSTDDTADAASTSSEETATDTDGEETGEPCTVVLELTNHSTNAIEVIHFLACDMSDRSDYPVPPPGLADGDSASFPFPGPGCWLLSYEGEGCFNDQIVMTGELACGDVYAWTPDSSDHVCSG
jgi:hypothetical protein